MTELNTLQSVIWIFLLSGNFFPERNKITEIKGETINN